MQPLGPRPGLDGLGPRPNRAPASRRPTRPGLSGLGAQVYSGALRTLLQGWGGRARARPAGRLGLLRASGRQSESLRRAVGETAALQRVSAAAAPCVPPSLGKSQRMERCASRARDDSPRKDAFSLSEGWGPLQRRRKKSTVVQCSPPQKKKKKKNVVVYLKQLLLSARQAKPAAATASQHIQVPSSIPPSVYLVHVRAQMPSTRLCIL